MMMKKNVLFIFGAFVAFNAHGMEPEGLQARAARAVVTALFDEHVSDFATLMNNGIIKLCRFTINHTLGKMGISATIGANCAQFDCFISMCAA